MIILSRLQLRKIRLDEVVVGRAVDLVGGAVEYVAVVVVVAVEIVVG